MQSTSLPKGFYIYQVSKNFFLDVVALWWNIFLNFKYVEFTVKHVYVLYALQKHAIKEIII